MDALKAHADRATVKEQPDGTRTGVLVVKSDFTGNSQAMATLVGKDVTLRAGETVMYGSVERVTLKPKMNDTAIIVGRALIGGASELQALVGRQLEVEARQMNLPEVPEAG